MQRSEEREKNGQIYGREAEKASYAPIIYPHSRPKGGGAASQKNILVEKFDAMTAYSSVP
jgi:hypothetical protein